MIIRFEIDCDRLMFVRLRAVDSVAADTVEFAPNSQLFLVCSDDSRGHSADLDGSGIQLTDTPEAYDQHVDGPAVPVKLNWAWVEV